MALFEDFFPEGGSENIVRDGIPVFSNPISGFNITTDVSVGGQILMLSHTIAQASLQSDDYIRIVIGANEYTGRITVNTNNVNWTVLLDAPSREVIPRTSAGTVSVSEITQNGRTTINGDVVLSGGGDLYTNGGDLITNGGDLNLGDGNIVTNGDVISDLRGNATSATSLQTARSFSISGDVVAPGVMFNGNEDVELQATLRPNIAGNGLARGADGSLNVNSGLGLQIINDSIELNPNVAGSGLTFTNGVLSVGSFNINNTLAYTGTSTTDADVLTSFVTAWNSADTASGGITVATGTRLATGDLLLLTNGASPATTASYIYTGSDVVANSIATNLVAARDFTNITQSGDVVQTITAGSGISVAGTTTSPVISAVADPNGAVSVTGDGIALRSAAYGSGIVSGLEGEINVVGGVNITARQNPNQIDLDPSLVGITGIASTNQILEINTGTSEVRFSGDGITDGTDTVPNFGVIGGNGQLATRTAAEVRTLLNVQDPISGTAGTLPVFNSDGDGLEDSLISQAQGSLNFGSQLSVDPTGTVGGTGTTVIFQMQELLRTTLQRTNVLGPTEADAIATFGRGLSGTSTSIGAVLRNQGTLTDVFEVTITNIDNYASGGAIVFTATAGSLTEANQLRAIGDDLQIVTVAGRNASVITNNGNIVVAGLSGTETRNVGVNPQGQLVVQEVSGGVSGTGGTIPVFNNSDDGVGDSAITQTTNDVVNFTGYGLQTSAAGALEIRDISGHTVDTANVGRTISLSAATGATDALNSATGRIYTILSADAGNFYTLTNDGSFGNSIATISFATGVGEIRASVSGVRIASDTTIAGNTTINGGAVISGSTNNLQVGGLAGTGIRNVVVQADGTLISQTSTSGPVPRYNLMVASLATPSEVNHGDLVVLPPITQDRTFALPSNPTAGTQIQVSNLSSTGTGSGNFTWGFTNHGGRVMNTSITGTFELDDSTASFTLVYTNDRYGWVIIGAN